MEKIFPSETAAGRRTGLLTELRDRRVQLGHVSSLGIKLLDLGGWHRFVGLAGGPVHGLHPEDAVLLVVAGKDHRVAFLHGIEKCSATLQAWQEREDT